MVRILALVAALVGGLFPFLVTSVTAGGLAEGSPEGVIIVDEAICYNPDPIEGFISFEDPLPCGLHVTIFLSIDRWPGWTMIGIGPDRGSTCLVEPHTVVAANLADGNNIQSATPVAQSANTAATPITGLPNTGMGMSGEAVQPEVSVEEFFRGFFLFLVGICVAVCLSALLWALLGRHLEYKNDPKVGRSRRKTSPHR